MSNGDDDVPSAHGVEDAREGEREGEREREREREGEKASSAGGGSVADGHGLLKACQNCSHDKIENRMYGQCLQVSKLSARLISVPI